MKTTRRLVLLRLLLLSIVGLLSPLLRNRRASAAGGLFVYGEVPGLSPSKHFKVRVRPAGGTDKDWQSVFAFETATKATLQHFQDNAGLEVTKGYIRHMPGWTHTYVNFETEGAVDVEISLAGTSIDYIAPPTISPDGTVTNGQAKTVNGIVAAAVHPRRKSSKPVDVRGGKVVIRLDQPCQVAVDINGQLDNQRTGSGAGYSGRAVHTISIFANPPITNKPKKGEPNVRYVEVGQSVPTNLNPGDIVFFAPGVHKMETKSNGYERIDKYIPLKNGCSYYIPGDAIVYGRFNTGGNTENGNRVSNNGSNIRIFGHGTLSGANVPNPRFTNPPIPDTNGQHSFYRPIDVFDARNTKVEGITIVDSANLSIMLTSDDNGEPNSITWTKIITWRVNGDGINPSGNTAVADCFLRTGDDGIGTKGPDIRRLVLWNDANGSSFRLHQLATLKGRLVVQGCDVIYARSYLQGTSASRVFNVRGDHRGDGANGANQVIFRNINIEDPWPTLQHFFICLEVPPPYNGSQTIKGTGNFSNIFFENISIAKLNVLKEPELLWGHAGATISNFTFKNLKVRNNLITSQSNFFKKNEFVSNIRFQDANGNFV